MRSIVTCREMKSLDRNTIVNMGVPSLVLMERASLKTVQEMEAHFEKDGRKQKILCVCGSGNNGGDGVAVARILFLHGYDVSIFMAGNPEHLTEETSCQLKIAENYKVPVVNNPELDEYTTIVDAIFGIGLARPVEGTYRELISRMNEADAWKVAVDIPSGVDGDTGKEWGIAFHADLTVTFAFCKAGLVLYPGRKFAGRVVTADIGIYRDETIMKNMWQAERKDLDFLKDRSADGNKGTFGKVLAVAGSEGMCGAAYLCGEGAFSVGAGMVKIRTAKENRIPLQTILPEAMFSENTEDVYSMEKDFDWCDVLIIGPGIGLEPETAEKISWFLKKAGEKQKPVILDADGLNLLAANPGMWKSVGNNVILTPHIGEMSRLTGMTIKELKEDPAKAARELAAEKGCVCVMKDACTTVAGPDGDVYLNLSGNPGMATAGSGDALAGILAGVMCRKRNVGHEKKMSEMAAIGVYLHGLAGDSAAEATGMCSMKAGDILKNVSEVLRGDKNEKI